MPSVPCVITGTITWSETPPAQPPLGIWGGGNVPYPTPPIAPGGPPPTVSPPIYYPPTGIWGGGNVPYPTPPIAPGGPPLGTWGGGNVPYPTPPIFYPPEQPASPPAGEGRWGYVPGLGWVWIPSGEGDKPHPPQP